MRPAVALGLITTLSAVVHTALAWARATPNYFPDEYIYAELGRSVVESGRPLVRGAGPLFAPILHPVLTAPVWLVEDVATAHRLLQAVDALAMSLAAIPVYLIARRLHLSTGLALACAALAVTLPELLYAGWTMSEPLAYPLALGAVWAAVALFERPSLRLQGAFLLLVGLATVARLQLAAIPLCYLVAVAATGLRERRVRSLAREQCLALGALGSAFAVALVLGLRGHFGYYPSFTYVKVSGLEAVEGLGANALVLLYACGIVLVPGAVLGFALALVRPRSRPELAFGALGSSFLVALLLEATLYGDTAHVQQRYLLYGLPLVVVACALQLSRGRTLRLAALGLASVVALAVSLVPLAGFAAAEGGAQSLVLLAVRQLERSLGSVSLASLIVALAATVLSLLVPALVWARPPRAAAITFGAAAAAFLALTAGAFAFDRSNSAGIRRAFLGENPSWVDASGAGDVTLMLSPRGLRVDAHSTLYWNRSVDRVILFPGAVAPDVFASSLVEADDAGRLNVAGEPVLGPLLVDTYGMAVELRGAERLGAGPTKVLWRPHGQAQLLLAMPGRFSDGWLSSDGGGVAVWPRRSGARLAGRFELDLSIPADGRPLRFRLDIRAGGSRLVAVRPGRVERLRIPVCRSGVWAAAFATEPLAVSNGRRVGPRASQPRFVADAGACAPAVGRRPPRRSS